MKITITPNPEEGSAATPQPRVLGDDLAGEYIQLIPPIEGIVDVQTVALPRAPKKEKFFRFNAEVRFSFEVSRAHDSFSDAMAFAFKEVKEVKGIVGTLAMSGTGVTGGGSETISDCIISGVRVVDISSSTRIQYTVEGGDFD